MTLRPLQNWFENMSPRERFLLLAFAWAIVIIWASILLKQSKALKLDFTTKQATLKMQQASLDERQKVEDKINYYSKTFQTSISAAQLVNKVHQYVTESGMPQPTINSNKLTSPKGSVFNINSVTVTFNRVPFYNLLKFWSFINADKPLLMFDEVNMTPERVNPTLMDGSMRIQSLELQKGALDVASSQASGPATGPAQH